MPYEFTGTPGPWKAIAPDRIVTYKGADITEMSVYTEKTRNQLNAEGRKYEADLHSTNNIKICEQFMYDIPLDEFSANCHLIGAAPDLLNALARIVEAEESIVKFAESEGSVYMLPEWFAPAKEAIQKALNIK